MPIFITGSITINSGGVQKTIVFGPGAVAASGPAVVNWGNLDGISLASTTLTKTAANGAFTNSIAWQTASLGGGNFTLTWTIPVGYVGGGITGIVSTTPAKASGHTQYDYGLNLNDVETFPGSKFEIYELGTLVNNATAGVSGGETVAIKRVGDTITYYKNGSLVYTSLASASGKSFFVSTSPYIQATFLQDATVVA